MGLRETTRVRATGVPGPKGVEAVLPTSLREVLRGERLVVRRPIFGRRPGPHLSRGTGPGSDFRDLRPYEVGDDPRAVDWRALGRRDRWVVRETHADAALSLVLALDDGANMDYGEGATHKARHARALVAALGLLAVSQGDRVGIGIARDGDLAAEALRPMPGRARFEAWLEGLAVEAPRGRGWLEPLAAQIAEQAPRGSVVVVCSDFLDPGGKGDEDGQVDRDQLAAFALLRARGHEVVLVQVLHRDELEFPWHGAEVVRFEDLTEARPACEGPGRALRERYLAAFEAHRHHLETTCAREGLVWVPCVTDDAIERSALRLLSVLRGGAA